MFCFLGFKDLFDKRLNVKFISVMNNFLYQFVLLRKFMVNDFYKYLFIYWSQLVSIEVGINMLDSVLIYDFSGLS